MLGLNDGGGGVDGNFFGRCGWGGCRVGIFEEFPCCTFGREVNGDHESDCNQNGGRWAELSGPENERENKEFKVVIIKHKADTSRDLWCDMSGVKDEEEMNDTTDNSRFFNVLGKGIVQSFIEIFDIVHLILYYREIK